MEDYFRKNYSVMCQSIHALCLALLLLLPLSTTAQSDKQLPISQSKLASIIKSTVEKQKSVFVWKQADDHTLWSAGMQTDSLYSIGYQPVDAAHSLDLDVLQGSQWQQTKNDIIEIIRQHYENEYGSRYAEDYIFPYGLDARLPSISARIFDQKLLAQLKRLPAVSYLDVMTTHSIEKTVKSAGCSAALDALDPADSSATTPMAVKSWHHSFNNVQCAWDDGYAGQNIWIAIMDTGISPTQEKLNAEFAEGESAGRVIQKYNFYQTNAIQTINWEDQCGHGTAMTGLAAAPKGYENSAAGIAYQANIVSYRVTNDVVVNSADEKQGLKNAIMHAADDPNIKIISISLGDVFFNNDIALAIQYADSKDKLIFAAAGTSTPLTSWYPVIFPANMLETVAVTGITDDSSRERCDICHDGPEVDFVVVMQRQNDASRNAVTLAQQNNNNNYVGGSSAATASMAGLAAVTWSSNDTWSKSEVLNRLSQSGDNYPVRDNDFGWGIADVCQAADPAFSVPCSPLTSNDVTMTVTEICFPPVNDGFGTEAEWVLKFNGNSYYFDFPEVGGCAPVTIYVNTGACDTPPIIIPITSTSCGESSSTVFIESHENDGFFTNCDLGSSDDYEYEMTEAVSFSVDSLIHESPAGDIVIKYSLSCMATSPPLFASISVPEFACQNSSVTADLFANGGQSPYTITYQIDGGTSQTVTTTGNNASVNIPTSNIATSTYTLLSVADANNCSQIAIGSESVMVIANPTIAAAPFSTTSCNASDGSIEITTTGVPDGMYDINDSTGTLASIMITSGSGVIAGLPAGTYNDLNIAVNTCNSTEYPDVTVADPPPTAVICPADIVQDNDPSLCHALINYTLSGMDNCPGTLVQQSGLSSGSNFPVGVTTNNFQYTDDNNVVSQCSFTITINDVETPVVTDCLDINVVSSTCVDDVIVNFMTAATDNCSFTWSQTMGSPSGSAFAIGTHDISFVAADQNASVACDFQVTVLPIQVTLSASVSLPSIACQGESATADFTATGGQSPYIITYDVDGGPIQTVTTTGNDASVSINTSNITTMTYNLLGVSDANGCSQSISSSESVMVIPLPTISATPIGTTSCNASDGSIDITTTGVPDGSYDINSATGVIDNILITNGSGTIPNLPEGIYTDLSIMHNGCTSINDPDVTISDPAPTAITCPADIVQDNDPSDCGAIINYTLSGTGNCPGTLVQQSGLSSGSSFPVGVSTNSFEYTDNDNVTSMCSFTVTINDSEAPIVTGCDDIIVESTTCVDDVIVNFTAAAADNCSFTWTQTMGQASGSAFAIGTYDISFVAADQNVSVACDFQVTVLPIQVTLSASVSLPSIACHGESATVDFTANGGQSPYIITYEVDGGSIQTVTTTGNDASVSINTSNITTMTYNLLGVSDANGCSQSISSSESVMVIPLPTIAAAPIGTTSCNASDGSIDITTTGVPDGSYDINSAAGVIDNILITNGSGTIPNLPEGIYTDLSIMHNGCTSINDPDVTISDPAPTAITCPADIVQDNDPSDCGAIINYTLSGTGNCPGTLVQQSGLSSGSSFPVGVSTNSFEYTDNDNVTSMCSFTVTINDSEAPIVTGCDDIIVESTTCVDDVIVNFTAAAADNCSFTWNQTMGQASGSAFAIGTYDISFVAADQSSMVPCDFQVTVLPAQTDSDQDTIIDCDDLCPNDESPSQLSATLAPDLSVSLSWMEEAAATSWEIELVIGIATGMPTHTAMTIPYQINDLLPLTDYSFYVRSDCGMGAMSDWSGPFDFSTYCHPDFAAANQLINSESGTADYETDGIIESDQLIKTAAQVDYDSKVEILLKAGFEVESGAVFHAFIDGCGGSE